MAMHIGPPLGRVADAASLVLMCWVVCCAQVKRMPDVGSPHDSCVVKGVVAKKNVAHRRMRTDIDNPAVLLLSGALEYQRVANKLSSFDTLLDQEREHLRLAVARIAACK